MKMNILWIKKSSLGLLNPEDEQAMGKAISS
jgi:hypothetical protein